MWILPVSVWQFPVDPGIKDAGGTNGTATEECKENRRMAADTAEDKECLLCGASGSSGVWGECKSDQRSGKYDLISGGFGRNSQNASGKDVYKRQEQTYDPAVNAVSVVFIAVSVLLLFLIGRKNGLKTWKTVSYTHLDLVQKYADIKIISAFESVWEWFPVVRSVSYTHLIPRWRQP